LSAGPLGEGTPEAAWVPLLTTLPMHDGSLGVARVIVLAPHPDDEVLGCGGALQRWAAQGSLELWHVTSGELSHGSRTDVAAFAALRRDESLHASSELALAPHRRRWLGHPDGQVDEHALEHELRLALDPGSAVVAPLPNDGHPDHDAVGRAAKSAAQARGARATFYAVWAWHCFRPSNHALPVERAWRMRLTPVERSRKAHALACFHSQITPRAEHEAVLPPRVLAHFMRTDEIFFDEGSPH
jgi:LmbE family N-acetylglucosaminyl deacetylase